MRCSWLASVLCLGLTACDKAPASKAPADKAPADKAPSDKAPSDKAPADKAPADKAPAKEVPAVVDSKDSPAPAEADTKQPDAAVKVTGCQVLGDEDTKSMRLIGRASHAAARVDLTIDFGSKTMRGDDYKLEGGNSTPVVMKVDQRVKPETVEALRDALAATCVPRKTFTEDQHQAPGGYTVVQVTQADGAQLWVSHGPAQIKAPGELASVSHEQWDVLVAAWPKTEGKR